MTTSLRLKDRKHKVDETVRELLRRLNVYLVKYWIFCIYVQITITGNDLKGKKMHSIVGLLAADGSTRDHHPTRTAVVYRIFRDNTSRSMNFGIVLHFRLTLKKIRLLIFTSWCRTKLDQSYSYELSIPFVTPTTLRYTRTTVLN